jgi:hypothetical protein
VAVCRPEADAGVVPPALPAPPVVVLDAPPPHAARVTADAARSAASAGVFMIPPRVFTRRYDGRAAPGSTWHL